LEIGAGILALIALVLICSLALMW